MANINFIHFNGSESEWSQRIDSSMYVNDIVFAKIWNVEVNPPTCRYVIYSGTDTNGVHYIYDVPDINKFKELEELLEIDNGGSFTSADLKRAIELYLSDESQAITDLNANVSTGSPITIAQNVGYLKVGNVIPEGTNVEDLIRMIFTKVLGLSGANAPSAVVSGITATTMEVGDRYNGTVTATFTDGSWVNEDGWKKDGKTTQPYGCLAQTYKFTGMTTSEASAVREAVIENYVISYGSNNYVNCQVAYAQSVNVPVNQKDEALQAGSVNNTTTYKPQPAGSVTPRSAVIKGDHYYWIGYTSKHVTEQNPLTRADIENEAITDIVKKGFIGTGASYEPEFLTPYDNYVTIVVPAGFTLKAVRDGFGNDVTENFVMTQSDGGMIGKDTRKLYNVYQEYAQADSGLIRQKVVIG